MTHSDRGLRKLARSFDHAFVGFRHAVQTQQNIRIHLGAAVAVAVLGFYLGLDFTQWALLVLTIGFVLVAEMFNTVAEVAMDAATPHYHPLVKIAKDVAAGAVLIASIVSVIVGLLILGPPLLAKAITWFRW